MSEPTGPAFLRAFIVVFFPELAAEEGFDKIEASDEDLVQSGVEEIIEILSLAIADDDEVRQQFAHERLFQISIHEAGKKVEAEHVWLSRVKIPLCVTL